MFSEPGILEKRFGDYALTEILQCRGVNLG